MMFEVEDILKSTNIYLAAKDRNLKFLYCSEGFAELLDLDSPNTLIGKTDYDFYSTHLANLYRLRDNCVLKNEKGLQVHEPHPVHGKIMEIITTKNLLKNNSGYVRGVVFSFVKSDDMRPAEYSDTLEDNVQTQFFTKQEHAVFREVIWGATAKEIAKKISLSPRTVEDYINRIKIKLQCDSKYHIAESAIRLGILQQSIHYKKSGKFHV